MDSRSKQLFQKSLSTDICIPNTVVVPSDAAVDDEKVVLTIRLFNEELIPVFDGKCYKHEHYYRRSKRTLNWYCKLKGKKRYIAVRMIIVPYDAV